MKGNKDRQIIEDYLKLYCLEELFDEIINSIIDKKPQQPFQYISKFIIQNTMPEILKIKISSRIIGNNNIGIYVEVYSNIGTFTGVTSQPYDIDNQIPTIHDYSLIELRIEEALLPLDPQDFNTIDQILGDLFDIDPPIILATSIACLRMSAKYQNVEVYNMISNLCGVEPSIPLPIPTVLTRLIEFNDKKYYQYYQLYPVSSSNVASAIETIIEFNHRLHRIINSLHTYDTPEKINKLPTTNIPSSETLELINFPIHISHSYGGSITVERISMEKCLKFLTTVLEEDGENLPVRISVDCQGSLLSNQSQITNPTEKASMTYSYFSSSTTSSSSPPKTNIETVETLIMLWKEYEIISFEDPFHPRDRLPFHHMKMRIDETMTSLRNDEARELPYAQRGIGSDLSCPLQIVIDQLCQTPQEINLLGKDFSTGGVNTIKFRLEKFSTITRAILFCKTVYENKWNLIISCNETSPETYDTFLSDFAVGVGAYQFMGGGLNSCEYNCKYNRLIEIQQNVQTSIQYVGSRYRKKFVP